MQRRLPVTPGGDDIAPASDLDFWWPYVAEVLSRHGLADAASRPVAGFNPTHPTFVCGSVVVKIFGSHHAWRMSYRAERMALSLVATDPEIAAPAVLGRGHLYADRDASWPYLVTSRMVGSAAEDMALSSEQRLALAAQLGGQVRRVHALLPSGVATEADWPAVPTAVAAARSSLPPHLVAQVDDFVARVERRDPTFVHADLCSMHVFVESGRLSAIIDWGDAMVTDPHVELIQPYRDIFGCDAALLRVFLDASDWPVGPDFPRRALSCALYRQAVGLAQHHTIDVFEPIAARFPLRDIGTLDELATVLFSV